MRNPRYTRSVTQSGVWYSLGPLLVLNNESYQQRGNYYDSSTALDSDAVDFGNILY